MSQKELLSIILLVSIYALFVVSCDKESPTEAENILLTKVSGDGQTGVPGDTLSAPLVVLVTDSNGRAVQGQWLEFRIIEGSANLSDSSVVTNEIGKAETKVIFGDQEGNIRVEAKMLNTNITVIFSASANNLPPESITIVNGNNQSGDPGDILPVALQVMVKNERNIPVEGSIVDFSIVEGKGALSVISDTTDTYGFAQTILTLGDSIGMTHVTALLDTLEPVIFIATVLPPCIVIIEGNNQTGPPRRELQPLQVQIKSGRGIPLEDAEVAFSIVEGTGTLTALHDVTNFNGIAQTILTLGDSIGTTRVVASLDSLNTVIFTAMALPSRLDTTWVLPADTIITWADTLYQAGDTVYVPPSDTIIVWADTIVTQTPW